MATTAKQAGAGTSGRPGAHDFLNIDGHLSDEERGIRDEIRSFVRARIGPNIREWWERAVFPRELVLGMGSLGLLGIHDRGRRRDLGPDRRRRQRLPPQN